MTAARSGSPLLARLVGHPIATDVAIIGPDGVAGGAGTYGAIGARARALSGVLRAGRRSLEGARIAFLVAPGRAWVDTLYGILLAGGCAVPLSPLHTAPELEHLVRDAGPLALVADSELAARLEPLRDGRPLHLTDARREPHLAPDAEPTHEWPALILYTSGTTGKPKGVALTHGGVAATLAALEEAWRWQRRDRLLHVLPLHHTHGVVVALLGSLWAGATARLVPFEAERVWDLFSEATVFMGVPTMHHKLMEAFRAAPGEKRAQWSNNARQLRLVTSGSAALPPSLLAAFAEASGHTILERYGMTEIGMALSNPYDGPRVPGAVGVPLPGVEVDLVDDEGRDVTGAEPGELRVRSPQLFAGYHGDRAATLASYDERGRFRTGDTGTRDEQGVIRLLGRTSTDVLKSGGYKLSALEIEEALRAHPAIEDVAVVGLPDETWGDAVTACVVMRAGASLSLEELRAWSKERLAPYKVPRRLDVLDVLPRNAMGKVQKKALRDALMQRLAT
ncbi:MAG: acyl-CoA synthetase [Polyangiales bacterium]